MTKKNEFEFPLHIKVYGRASCSFCKKANKLVELLARKYPKQITTQFIEGLSKDKLTELVGKKVHTVPQVFINNVPVGGFTEFKNLSVSQEWILQEEAKTF